MAELTAALGAASSCSLSRAPQPAILLFTFRVNGGGVENKGYGLVDVGLSPGSVTYCLCGLGRAAGATGVFT